MRLLKNLLRFSRRKWTVEEVHALIGSGHLDQAAIAARDLNELTPDIDRMRRCLNAEIAFHRGDDEAAEDGYRAVLTEAPGFAEAHYGLSMLLLERDDVERALSHAQFAKIAQPDSSRFLAQAGLCFLRQGSLAVAEKMLKQVVRERSGDKVSWNNLGIVLLSKGEPGEAQVAFKRALAIDPSFEKAVCNLRMLESDLRDAGMRIIDRTGPSTSAPLASTRANVSVTVASGDVPELDGAREMARNGSVDEALRAAEDALSHSPDNSALACAVARFYCEQGEPQGGVELLNAFLVGRPPDATVLATLGACHMANHDERAAIEALSQAMAAGDESPRLRIDLGACLHSLERYEEALPHFRKAAEDMPSDENRLRLAAILVSNCKYDEALSIYEDMASRVDIRRDAYLANYTYALIYSGRFEEARKNLGEMLALAPNDVNIRTTRAVISLLHQDFETGWQDYAYRGISFSRHFRTLAIPRWQGEPLHGKRIVLIAEQGLGDQVMFASCLPDLLALGAQEVIVEVVNRVAKTIARSFPSVTVVPSNQKNDMAWLKDLGSVDYFTSLGDLPASFRRHVNEFPRRAYLVADAERTSFWRDKLAAVAPRPWIGVSWRGGTEITRKAARTMSILDLQGLEPVPGGSLVCLQYGDVTQDLSIAAEAGLSLHHWPEAIADLDEFAALIAALDGVVTVCNTTVHYAGALGKPVWVLAPKVPEWRYGLTNDFMPWYPHAKVVRQVNPLDWRHGLETANQEFRQFWRATH
jgi:tetratricopeptide (TPR) repeat protein